VSEEDRPDHTPDEAEIARITWTAQHDMIEVSRKATERYGLDPSLTEDLEDAARRHISGDWSEWDAALVRFVRALLAARGLD
jgi:hypothetical protein